MKRYDTHPHSDYIIAERSLEHWAPVASFDGSCLYFAKLAAKHMHSNHGSPLVLLKSDYVSGALSIVETFAAEAA